MRKQFLLMTVSLLIFNGCSPDAESDTTAVQTPPEVVVKTAKITSYSKNSGEAGDTVTMYGENFSDKVSDIKITFDGVAATVVSATATEIVFTLPQTAKVLPELVLTIENRTIYNAVQNDYNGNIGILPTRSLTDWAVMENSYKTTEGIVRIQMVSDKILYYNTTQTGGQVYRTLDGGITWQQWAQNGFSGAFHATVNDEGWCHTGFGVSKINKGGYLGIDNTFAKFGDAKDYGTAICLYVDDNMQNGTWVSRTGQVFTTTNGTDFTKVYDANLDDKSSNTIYNKGVLTRSVEIDNDHMWIVGYKNTLGPVNGVSVYTNKPFILYKNNTTDGWKEYPFVNEAEVFYPREICFTDTQNGFLLVNNSGQATTVKLFKTTNGGDSWDQVYKGELFTKFTFKDANTGWAILDNKIYKTENGGSAWTLDYTHEKPIKNISYKNNVVWAFSTDKITKRYL